MSYGRLLLLSVVLVSCVRHRATTTAQSAAAGERLIRDLEERDRIAVLQRDYAPLDELWSPRLMVTTPANTVVPDSAAVRALKRSGQGNYARFERHIEQLRIEGSVAVVMGYEIVEPMAPSPLAGQTVSRRFTNVWTKTEGRWRLLARHVSNICRAE